MVEGRVISRATGAPLKGAIVNLWRTAGYRGVRIEKRSRQTGDDGGFRFTNVNAGNWALSAEKRGFSGTAYSGAIAVPGGKNGDIVLRLVPQAVIVGRVLDADGEPVEGARVSALRASYFNGVRRWKEAASAVTLDNGEYRIARLSAGRYLVRCGFARVDEATETSYSVTYHPNATDAAEAAVVDLKEGGVEIADIDIRVTPVRLFHVRGRTVPPAGVVLRLLDKTDPSKEFDSTSTNLREQQFDFSRVPPGSYLLSGWLETGSFRYRVAQPVEVKADVDGLVLVAMDSEIRGRIRVKPEGARVDLGQLKVVVWPVRSDGTTRLVGPRAAVIAADLTFQQELGAREYTGFWVEVSNLPPNCYVDSIRYGGADIPESGINYAPGAALEIAIGTDGAAVNGKATDQDGNPREGAVAALIPADGKGARRTAKSGPGGAFHIGPVAPGDYRLIAWEEAQPDEIEDPDFVKPFESQAAGITLVAGESKNASIRVVAR